MKIKNLKEKLFNCGLLLAFVVLYRVVGISCVFKHFLGITCPGCGMTRAWIRVLHLDLARAFQMHAMFWSVPLLLAYYMFDGKLFRSKVLNIGLLVIIAIGFLANWLVRIF